ncbi:FCD domain-containing protein [Streptomyces sp. NPDC001027]|uniref:FadR/GntR family transcriptional regulator n=1 Tax=Streptomyces sp. NPDC001027 TaxID=3154771 RepID=UPI00331FF271
MNDRPTDLSVAAPKLGQRVLRPREQVEEAIKEAVLDGRLRAGTKLPAESELARQFSVSRPTIREALSSLQTKGLIRKVPGMHGGSFVQAVDYKALGQVVQESMHNLLKLGGVDFEEVALVREHLEVPSVMLAAGNRTEADVAELRGIVKEQKSRSVDDPLVPELDARFHTAIARMSGNRVLASLVFALHRETEPVHHLDLSPEVGRETVAQHDRIVKAIADGDAAAGEKAIKEHLAYLREHVSPASVPSGAGAGATAD